MANTGSPTRLARLLIGALKGARMNTKSNPDLFADELIEAARQIKRVAVRNESLPDEDIDALLNAYALLQACAGGEIGRSLMRAAAALAKRPGRKAKPRLLSTLLPKRKQGGRPTTHTDGERRMLISLVQSEKSAIADRSGTPIDKITDRSAIDAIERRCYPHHRDSRRSKHVTAVAKILSRYRKLIE